MDKIDFKPKHWEVKRLFHAISGTYGLRFNSKHINKYSVAEILKDTPFEQKKIKGEQWL